MCYMLETLCEALQRHVQGLDVASLSPDAAAEAWLQADRVVRLGEAAKTLLAARAAESTVWAEEGCANAATWMARRGGTTVGRAKRDLETSKRVGASAPVEEAVRDGRLSAQQAELVAGAAVVAGDEAAEELIAAAQTDSLGELQDECRRRRAAADPDPEGTERRIHERRSLRMHTDAEGAWQLHATGTVGDGAEVQAVLDELTEQAFRRARAEGPEESREAYAFDALVELARRAKGETQTSAATPVRAKVSVVVSAETLRRGWVEGEERCEIPGVGPISVRRAREYLTDAALRLFVVEGREPLAMVSFSRKPLEAQRLVLLLWGAVCSRRGCGRRDVQLDHRRDWAETRHTTLDELDLLCTACHALKTRRGWSLEEGRGKRDLVPPEDERHPKNKPKEQAA